MKTDSRFKKLQEKNKRLKQENKELREELRKTRKEKKHLEKEFEDYRVRHPEHVGVKHGKPYAIKASTRNSAPKKPGAKRGHKAHFRTSPEHVDETLLFPVDTCRWCHGSELSEVLEERTRTIEGISLPRPVVTRCRIQRRYCRTCKRIVECPVTLALPKSRISLETMLFVVYCKIGLRLPISSVQQLLEEMFGLHMSRGEICLILEQMAHAFESYYDQLLQELRDASARHMDETGWRINGVNSWLWAFVTKWTALYKIALSRNHKVPLEVLGETPKGVDIHDRLAVYGVLSRKTGNRPQQYCWSHILADSKELAQFNGSEGEHIHTCLKRIYTKANEFNHEGTDTDIEQLFQEMVHELDRFYQSHHCYKFVQSMKKAKDKLFQFVKNPDVEGTNNRAERALRHSVIARKISGGSKSSKGARTYEVLLTVYHTLKLRNQNLLTHGPTIVLTSHG